MSIENTQTLEVSPLPEVFAELVKNNPRAISGFVPTNAEAQKVAFLADELDNPHHSYDRLEGINFEERHQNIADLGSEIVNHPELNKKFRPVYEGFIEGYKLKNRFMEVANAYNHATGDEKAQYREEYMRLNIELHGAPDETIYRSLLQEQLSEIGQAELTGDALLMRYELFELVGYNPNAKLEKRYQPEQETIDWMHEVVESLYGDMLAHVPVQDSYSPEEVRSIFEKIINEEFGLAAEGWRVITDDSSRINVKASEKKLIIPSKREAMDRESLRELIVHELGVHVLRAITGFETDLQPLGLGLNEYYNAEEGLGVVMEQALRGKFSERGVNHYITAGLAYYENMNFREAYEVKWRIDALKEAIGGKELTSKMIDKSQDDSYTGVMRIFRGTDDLPWFKDLAYYNGAVDMWRHLESIRGDALKFMFVLLGKANPANKTHEQILLETSTL